MHDPLDALKLLFAQPIAHRGLHACGRPGPVENSLGAATAAIAAGYAIECDVQGSRDGEAMVFHDASLERLTSMGGALASLDAATLRALQLRNGPDNIPTFADLLATIDGQVPLVVEIKSANGEALELVDRILAVLDGYPGPVALESFDPRVVLRCRERGTSRPLGLVGPPEGGAPIDPRALEICDFLSWSIDRIEGAMRLRPTLPLSTWTVRTPGQASRAAACGAQIVFEGFTPSSSVNPVGTQ